MRLQDATYVADSHITYARRAIGHRDRPASEEVGVP